MYLRVRQAVVDPEAVLAPLDQPFSAQNLQMLGGVRERERRLARQVLHRPLALREQIEEFQPMRIGEGSGDTADLRVEALLEVAMLHDTYSSILLHLLIFRKLEMLANLMKVTSM